MVWLNKIASDALRCQTRAIHLFHERLHNLPALPNSYGYFLRGLVTCLHPQSFTQWQHTNKLRSRTLT